ncbi:hypothetical protein ACWCJF_004706, partial [Salmonella enterica subsp. enterica serovar Infantis]
MIFQVHYSLSPQSETFVFWRANAVFPSEKLASASVKGTVAKLAMRQPFVLFKGLTFQKLCLPGAFRPGD